MNKLAPHCIFSSIETINVPHGEKSCISCDSIINSTQVYNRINTNRFLTNNSSSNCQLDGFFGPILTGNNTHIRCRSGNNRFGFEKNALKCPDPSNKKECLSQMTCLPCSDITSDENAQDFLTHGNCSCDSSSQICNDDNACGDGAIVNNENKCQCLFDHILATD